MQQAGVLSSYTINSCDDVSACFRLFVHVELSSSFFLFCFVFLACSGETDLRLKKRRSETSFFSAFHFFVFVFPPSSRVCAFLSLF